MWVAVPDEARVVSRLNGLSESEVIRAQKGDDMEARSRFIGVPREAALVLAAAILVLAALAGGYVIRFATAPSSAPAVTVVSGAGSSPAQPDAPCIWAGSHKAC